MNPDGTPHESNKRSEIGENFEDLWFGFEQEYFIYDKKNKCVLGHDQNNLEPQGKYYCGVGEYVAGRDFVSDGIADVAEIRAGDPAPDGSGPLELARGIEIGHVFQLGRKYAEALDLKVLDENGKLVTVTMGSYGIGVTRIIAVLAEANNDEKGLIWPSAVSPVDIHVVAAGKDDVIYETAARLAQELEAKGKSVLLDDRLKVSPGVKFSDAELLGIPQIVIVGRGLENGEVDLWDRRSGDRRSVNVELAVTELT
jgi:prolyl-tRNA synthetase